MMRESPDKQKQLAWITVVLSFPVGNAKSAVFVADVD